MGKKGSTKARKPIKVDSVARIPIPTTAMVTENGRHTELSRELHRVAKASDKFVKGIIRRLERKKPNPDGTVEIVMHKDIPQDIKPYTCQLTIQSSLVRHFKGVPCTTYIKNGKKIIRLITKPRVL